MPSSFSALHPEPALHPEEVPARALPMAGLLLVVLSYPFLLDAYHWLSPAFHEGAGGRALLALLFLLFAIAVPFVGVAAALEQRDLATRRFAYAMVAAPTLYVFLGVVQALLGSPLPDALPWSVLWLLLVGVLALQRQGVPARQGSLSCWRVAHGVSGLLLLAYLAFHLFNHLFFVAGETEYNRIMKLGEQVYRAPFVEPVLVALLLFQVATGARLFWRWSAARAGFARTLQVASGVYLLAYIVGHMNSVFVYARLHLAIPSDWAFAVGAPAGLLFDAWNIRLLPHYLLGVFFVLAHLACGARSVLLAHGMREAVVHRLWAAGILLAAGVALFIVAGMAGLRF